MKPTEFDVMFIKKDFHKKITLSNGKASLMKGAKSGVAGDNRNFIWCLGEWDCHGLLKKTG